MSETLEFDLKQVVLLNDTFGPREVRQMQEASARDFLQYAVLRDAVGELQTREDHTPASRVRLGVCLYLLGRYYRAIEVLMQADGGAMAHYYLAKCHFARQEYREAIESYQAAAKAGYDGGQCALGRAEAFRCAGDATAAAGSDASIRSAASTSAAGGTWPSCAVSASMSRISASMPRSAKPTTFAALIALATR